MNVGLAVAGLLCVALGLGHTAVGLIWVLPGLTEERLPRTPFGDPRTVLLRWLAAMWLAATAMAFGVARPRPRDLLRLPVPLL